MYRKIEDFKRDWSYETEQTVKLLSNLTDESLNQKVVENGRSIGFLAWHLTQTMGEMLGKVGLTIDAPDFETDVPATAAEIVEKFAAAAKSVAAEIAENWTDETLEVTDEMYGETWTRGQTLFYLTLHQVHHRGQITVLMRQAGIPVVGIYGPAKEEWEAMGMPAMA